MSILVLESITGLGGEVDARLFPEGFGMLRTMVNEFSAAGFDVVTPLNPGLEPLAGWLDADVCTRNGVEEALSRGPDAALVIAPERGGILEHTTAKLRKRGIPVLGAQRDAIRTSADKWLTYLALRGKVPQPKTWKKRPNVAKRVLVKPMDGVGCEGIGFLPIPRTKGVIFQEFLSGAHASCCLLIGNDGGAALSVNGQEISINGGRFEYLGGKIPLGHKLDKMCAETSLRAAGALGLWGFCGVDLVISARPYVIEVNPRPTTSFIALAEVAQANLGELLVDALIDGSAQPGIKINGHSVLRIVKIDRNVGKDRIDFDELREISGVVAPPLAPDGCSKSSAMLVTGTGNTAESAERDLFRTTEEALSILGVDGDVDGWS